jgi:sugar lactone lactonase YvrE
MVLAGADGLALLEDGNLYINSVTQSTLLRIDVKKDGSAGAITKLETSRPLMGPDGMRSVGKKTLLLVEGGRLDEVTIDGDNPNRAEIKVLKEGLTGITAVTLTGGNAYVVEAKLNLRADTTKDPGPFKAMGIPYKAPK